MYFRLIYDEALAQAAYLIGCQKTGEAIVIDPQRDVDRYIQAAAAAKLRIVAVTETHIHADFLSGTRELAEQTGAMVYLSDEGGSDWKYQWLGQSSRGGPYKHTLLHDGEIFRVGQIEFKVIHTPGHTPEHICFLVTDRGGGAGEAMGVATGDFVFVGDLGRPDLLETAAGAAGTKEASARSLFESARKFNALPDYLQVWPGHGAGSACGKALGAVPQSTVGYEKRFNPSLLAAADREKFVANILHGQPDPPLYFARMKLLNKLGPPILGQLPQPAQLTVSDVKSLDFATTAILDARPWPQFKAGHLPGALLVPPGAAMPAIAGSYVSPDDSVVLVVDAAAVEQAVRLLVRVGVDDIRGFITPRTLSEYAAAGGRLETSEEIDVTAFKQRLSSPGAFILDVRAAAEFEAGHIDGATHATHTRLPAHLDGLPRNQPLLVHCLGGFRSAIACSLLQRHGFEAINIAGGYAAWERARG